MPPFRPKNGTQFTTHKTNRTTSWSPKHHHGGHTCEHDHHFAEAAFSAACFTFFSFPISAFALSPLRSMLLIITIRKSCTHFSNSSSEIRTQLFSLPQRGVFAALFCGRCKRSQTDPSDLRCQYICAPNLSLLFPSNANWGVRRSGGSPHLTD